MSVKMPFKIKLTILAGCQSCKQPRVVKELQRKSTNLKENSYEEINVNRRALLCIRDDRSRICPAAINHPARQKDSGRKSAAKEPTDTNHTRSKERTAYKKRDKTT